MGRRVDALLPQLADLVVAFLHETRLHRNMRRNREASCCHLAATGAAVATTECQGEAPLPGIPAAAPVSLPRLPATFSGS